METGDVFESVYAAYGPALYHFCLVQLGSPADAEDALQEVFCKRLYRAPAFRTPEHERRWLFRVAVNQCRDARRRRRGDLPLWAADVPAPAPEDLGLLEALAALPDRQREALHLHYGEGYSVAELAALQVECRGRTTGGPLETAETLPAVSLVAEDGAVLPALPLAPDGSVGGDRGDWGGTMRFSELFDTRPICAVRIGEVDIPLESE